MSPVILVILDGWGIAPPGPGNAISQANLPFWQYLNLNYPHGTLEASGEEVGLPRGQDGNTETGHLNLGAGYIVPQDLQRINYAIADGTFFQNRAFLTALDHARKYESNLHLLGLIGSGGVHSNLEHLLALLQLCHEQEFNKVYLHLITDGRDSPPKSALVYLNQLTNYLSSIKLGKIATIMGRFYAMDRDQRWDRTEKAYHALTSVNGIPSGHDVSQIINKAYQAGITDEFLQPTQISENGKVLPRISSGDSVIFYNFRIDRPRQLTRAFIMEQFTREGNKPEYDPFIVKYHQKHIISLPVFQKPFNRGQFLKHLYMVTMTEYSQIFHASDIAYPPHIVTVPLGKTLEENKLSQLHIAESEKERFVTYYFNGQREMPFDGEDREMIASPKVATYDLKPEMSTPELAELLRVKIRSGIYDFILVNVACPDMVAHTGNLEASIKACEAADKFVDIAFQETLGADGVLLVTADHGNAEELINSTSNQPDTEHSGSDVPFYIVSRQYQGKPAKLQSGILADVAPTILKIMGIDKPQSMNGRSLL